MKTKNTFKTKEILKIAKEMNANDFLLEFGQAVTIHDAENLLDMNEGMVNMSIFVKTPEKTPESAGEIFLLYIDGKFDSYSYQP